MLLFFCSQPLFCVFCSLLYLVSGVSNLIQQVCRLNKGLRLLNLSKTSLSSKGKKTLWDSAPPGGSPCATAHIYRRGKKKERTTYSMLEWLGMKMAFNRVRASRLVWVWTPSEPQCCSAATFIFFYTSRPPTPHWTINQVRIRSSRS